jgi:hypothetical protein
VGAGLLIRSFYRLLEVNPGFATQHILSMKVDKAAIPYQEYSQLPEEQQHALDFADSRKFQVMAERIRGLPE